MLRKYTVKSSRVLRLAYPVNAMHEHMAAGAAYRIAIPQQTISRLYAINFDCVTCKNAFNCTDKFFDPYLPLHYTTFMALRYLLAPQYLMNCCRPASGVASRQRLRSSNRHHLVVPRHRRSTLGRRAFCVAGPMTWNALPDDLRDPSLSADIFRKRLKTHLFRNALGHSAH